MQKQVDMSVVYDEVLCRFNGNQIVEYIISLFSHDSWGSVEEFIEHLEYSSCEAGSFGHETIYTNYIREKLTVWVDEINQAMEDYKDATGEVFTFEQLEDTVTFAVDWFSNEIASFLRCQTFYVATFSEDSGKDKAFMYLSEAEDYINKCISEAVSFEVEHSPYTITEDKYDDLVDVESAKWSIVEEKV